MCPTKNEVVRNVKYGFSTHDIINNYNYMQVLKVLEIDLKDKLVLYKQKKNENIMQMYNPITKQDPGVDYSFCFSHIALR